MPFVRVPSPHHFQQKLLLTRGKDIDQSRLGIRFSGAYEDIVKIVSIKICGSRRGMTNIGNTGTTGQFECRYV